ncbi:MAG: hypothetical protein ACFB51_16140 [Anaerolineae bacterium]
MATKEPIKDRPPEEQSARPKVDRSELPTVEAVIKPIHYFMVRPIQWMDRTSFGPFGGGFSISPIIEAAIQYLDGQEVTVPLTDTERFMFNRLKDSPGTRQLIDYRGTQFAIQEKVLELYGDDDMGVIWIGAGIVSDRYPLISNRKPGDIHVWTDKKLRLVETAKPMFQEMKDRLSEIAVFQDLMLPDDIDTLNKTMHFFENIGIKHIIISLLGVMYAMTPEENYEWLRQLYVPPGTKLSFMLSSVSRTLSMPGKVSGAIDNQPAYHYDKADVEAIWKRGLGRGSVVHTIPRTENVAWETWLYHVPASS